MSPRRSQRQFVLTFSAIVAAVSLNGCMLATQQDMLRLGDDINSMRKKQADLVTKMTELNGNLAGLNSQLESSQQRMTTLSQKLDDLQADLARRFNVLTGQVTGTSGGGSSSNPSDAYRVAFNDYQAGKFELALVGFRNFAKQFPSSELAPQAIFYAGECEFARKNFLDAAREYARVVDQYGKSDFAPKALFKRGMSLQQINRTNDAKETMRRLIKEHPNHELARSARAILKELE
jgi:tol-pal system protein YbgF